MRLEDCTDRTSPVDFWADRNAIFVANILNLFFGNEEETQMLREEVGELPSYGGRLIPMLDLVYAGPEKNLLVLERAPDPALIDYFGETMELSLPDFVIGPHPELLEFADSGRKDYSWIERMEQHAAHRLDGYVTDDALVKLAAATGKPGTFASMAGSRDGNNKGMLHDHLVSQGLPTPPTEKAESPEEVLAALKSLAAQDFRAAVVKAPLGASGIGLIKVRSIEDDGDEVAASVPKHFMREGPCMVQGWLEPGRDGIERIHSPSIQLFLDNERVVLFDVTEQILSDDSVHEGNESPPPYLNAPGGEERLQELARQAKVAGTWLHERGYRGTASVDFLLTEKAGGDFDAYVCEINARTTGATYPSVLARHLLPEGAWLLRNLRFTEPTRGVELLGRLRVSGHLFRRGVTERGVFPVNFNVDPEGLVQKGQFLCLAPRDGASRTLMELAKLDLPCLPDRD
ncbi:MAG: hypothetical protein AAGA58_01125 [Verrucomicrobiota bacterium]